jgi:hypothetical protein
LPAYDTTKKDGSKYCEAKYRDIKAKKIKTTPFFSLSPPKETKDRLAPRHPAGPKSLAAKEKGPEGP